jgi:FKBP-type peptidyl-prolyl cis-trans isomerase
MPVPLPSRQCTGPPCRPTPSTSQQRPSLPRAVPTDDRTPDAPPLVTRRHSLAAAVLTALAVRGASPARAEEAGTAVDAAVAEAQAALAAEGEAVAAAAAAAAAAADQAAGPAPPQPESGAALKSRLVPSRTDTVLDGGTTTLLPTSAAADLTPAEKTALDVNRRVQAQNAAPDDGSFPLFVRQGYDIKVLADGFTADPETGLIYRDLALGDTTAPFPTDGQEVVFDYTAFNESGARIDSSASKGRPAQVRLGIGGLIPGFELGLRGMRPGGARRLVVPPELGPPVGPQTFFSAKQCEVFDVQLRAVRSCRRRQVAMFSDVVCE